ncbi:localization factor PodJL [Faunimonas pinastri]|uniref:Localization factor PodJL n=1 Tax=Faunimonas pinastri TaxID=1855383 RepID=A0A1H9HNC5_9HYPH|nr:peptidoglycan-binding protein [Faunimonas pinastri]SEQ63834.1 localization factor PodJL [Faunimonas pinastri]
MHARTSWKVRSEQASSPENRDSEGRDLRFDDLLTTRFDAAGHLSGPRGDRDRVEQRLPGGSGDMSPEELERAVESLARSVERASRGRQPAGHDVPDARPGDRERAFLGNLERLEAQLQALDERVAGRNTADGDTPNRRLVEKSFGEGRSTRAERVAARAMAEELDPERAKPTARPEGRAAERTALAAPRPERGGEARDMLQALARQVEELSRNNRSLSGDIGQIRSSLERNRDTTGTRLATLQERLTELTDRLAAPQWQAPAISAFETARDEILQRIARIEAQTAKPAAMQEVAARIEEIRGDLAALPSEEGLRRIEEHLFHLADRIDALPEPERNDDQFERLQVQLDTIANDVAGLRRARSSLGPDLQRGLFELASRLEAAIQARAQVDLAPVEARLRVLAERLPETPPADMLARIENRIAALDDGIGRQESRVAEQVVRALEEKLDAVALMIAEAGSKASRAALTAIERKLEGLRQIILEQAERPAAPAADFAALEDRLDQIQHFLSEAAHREQGFNQHLAPISEKLSDLSDRVAELSPQEHLQPLTHRLGAIEQQLHGISSGHLSDQSTLASHLENLVDRLDLMAGRDAFLPARLTAVLERLETVLEGNAGDERYGRIEHKLDTLHHDLQGSASVPDLELGELRQEILALRHEFLSTPAQQPTSGISDLLHDLLDRLEPVPSLQSHLEDLEQQVGRIMQAVDAPAADRNLMESMEASLRAIEARLEQGGSASVSEALRELRGLHPADDFSGELARTLNEDLGALRQAAEISDSHTRDSLGAVHDTLEAVVKRMAFLERELQNLPEGDRGAAEENFSRGAAQDTGWLGGDSLRGGYEAERYPEVTLEPADRALRSSTAPEALTSSLDTSDDMRGGLFGRLSSSQLLKRATGGRTESFSAGMEDADLGDTPLEPGTDAPMTSSLTDAPSSDTAVMSGKKKGHRRLFSGGKGAAAEETPTAAAFLRTPEDDAGDTDFLAAARRAARAASAEAGSAETATRQARGTTGAARIAGLLRARRSLFLAGALAVAVAFAALQYARMRSHSPEAMSQVTSSAPASPSATPNALADADRTPQAATATADATPAPAAPDAPTAGSQASGSEASGSQALGSQATGAQGDAQTAPTSRQASTAADTSPAKAPDVATSASTPLPSGAVDGPKAETDAPAPTAARSAQGKVSAAGPSSTPSGSTPPASSPSSVVDAAPDAPLTTGSLPAAGVKDVDLHGLPVTIGADRLRIAALGGDPKAEFEVAARYAEGRGVQQDLLAAAKWYQSAAVAGLAPAQYRLGSIYEKGIGVDKNPQTAQVWYQRAADAGNVKAMHNLAVLYAEGVSGQPDLKRAATLFHRAADQGVHDSQFNIAILYARGLGVPVDMIEAYKWFAVAATSGDKEAAKRRDMVAQSLSPSDLAKAKAAAEGFRPLDADTAANDVQPPQGGWGEPQATAASATSLPGTADLVQQVQQMLSAKGLYSGAVDGQTGPQTRKAISDFQKKAGLPTTGEIDTGLVTALQSSKI